MTGSIFAKTIGDRWRGWAIAVASLTLLFLVAMAAYRSIDLSIYTELPEAFRSLIGIPEEADVASLAINAMVSSYGAMTIAAMALVLGAAAVAGEERDGTLGVLLANPRSRTYVLVSKAAALVGLTGLAVLALWGAIVGSAAVLDVSIAGMHVGALALHLFLNSLFYGFVALAVGAWTGNRGSAIGASVGVMVVSFFAVGLLPLIESVEELVRAFPWHYFDGSDPLMNGVDWTHAAILAVASAALAGAAVIGVNRRDLKGPSAGVGIIDRLRAHPLTDRAVGRLAGSARVSGIWLKTVSEYQGLFLITAVYTFLIQGILIGPLYTTLPERALESFEQFPEEMLALFGGGDIGTPEGFYQIETYGMMAPVVVMILTIAIGAGALAGEESRRTMGMLLANPISRSRIVAEKAGAMTFYAFLMGFVTFAGVALGSILGDLGMSIGNIAVTSVLQALVGLGFGALALALSAATGRHKIAVFGAVGAAIALHMLNGLGELSDAMADLARISPFHYYLGNDPLNNGLDWSHAAVLVAICVALIGASFWLFERRDIRQRD